MADLALELIAAYGIAVLATITFLSCLALPVPSSLSLPAVALAAFAGAILGDNTGYWIARRTSDRVSHWLEAWPSRAQLRAKANQYMTKRGGLSVFLSCWLVAPLGPTMNYVRGMTRFPWPRFLVWGIAGEIVWVTLYVGLGYLFGEHMSQIAGRAGNISGGIAASVIAIGLGIWLARAARTTPGGAV